MQARWYQDETIDAVIWGWERFNRLLINLPTGSGKSFIAAKIIEQCSSDSTRCLFLIDQNELATQALRAVTRFTGIIPAIEKAQHHSNLESRTVIGSIQTMKKKRLERFPRDHFTHIVADEVHRITDAKSKVFDYFENAKVCGMTATPFRANLADLSKWFEHVAKSIPMIDLIGDGFAPSMRVLTLPVEIDLENIALRQTPDGKDYDLEQIESAIEPYFDSIAELIKENAQGRHGIAYLPLVKTSQAFASVLREHGITAKHVDGNSPDREQIIEGFARGQFSWLCNAALLSTGVDLPIASAFLNLRPSKSMNYYQQCLGRVMRPLPGVIDDLPGKDQAEERKQRLEDSSKPDSLIFDLLWQHDKLASIRPGSLFCDNEEDVAAFTRAAKDGSQDAIELSKRVRRERELQLIRALERAAAAKILKEPISHAGAAVLIGSQELVTYQPVSRWEFEPITDAQRRTLMNWGIDTGAVATKGLAKQLIDSLHHRMRTGFATLKQLRVIAGFNQKRAEVERINAENFSVEEAAQVISQEFSRQRNHRLAA